MSGTQLARSAARLLRRMVADAAPVRADDPRHAADGASLLAADLAERRADGTLHPTAAGRAFLLREANAGSGGPLDPFRAQHLDLMLAADRNLGDPVLVDGGESPLAWLARRKGRDGQSLIAPSQLQAGERLRRDFTAARAMPRLGVDWQRQGGSAGAAGLHVTEMQIAARQRLRQALNAAGPEFAGLLLDVCCFLKKLEDVERERHWPVRAAKIVLQLGLARLARHYGYENTACGRIRVPMRRWSAAPSSEEMAPD